jgi:hypothetical protein
MDVEGIVRGYLLVESSCEGFEESYENVTEENRFLSREAIPATGSFYRNSNVGM